MPLYGEYYGKAKEKPKMKKLKVKQIIDFQIILNNAKHSFKYSDFSGFLKSISLNLEFKEDYIATFDYKKSTNISQEKYIICLEELINKCNELSSEKFYPNKFRFDISGSWTRGNIIIIE